MARKSFSIGTIFAQRKVTRVFLLLNVCFFIRYDSFHIITITMVNFAGATETTTISKNTMQLQEFMEA